jgi:hypothetical protein
MSYGAHYWNIPAARPGSAAAKASRRPVREATTPFVPRFLHLLRGGVPVPYYEPPALEAPTRLRPSLTSAELAAQILAAGERSRSSTGVGVAPPGGLAAQILAAGEKRRRLA